MDFLEGGPAFSGYKWGDPTIHGFGTAHLSGAGCPALGGPAMMAFTGEPPTGFEAAGSAYRDEVAHAGYYAVTLDGPKVRAEMTATPRTAILRFDFDAGVTQPGLLLDCAGALSIGRDGGRLHLVSDTEVEGHVNFGFFCGQPNEGRVHFVARLDRPSTESGLRQNGATLDASEAEGEVAAFFRLEGDGPVTVSIGLSWVSTEGARANLEAEALDFDAARLAAEQAWQEVLGRVATEGGRDRDRRAFYTALYHAAIHPNVASDVDGGYLRFPTGEAAQTTETRHAVFSLWDTYRTLHPLLTLLYPARQAAMLRTMADMTSGGAPPKWELWGQEVQMMVGDPTAIVVADSIAKGLTDFDVATMFEVMDAAAIDPDHRPGVASYLDLGYIPMEEAGNPLNGGVWGPVSTTLEYALADWSLARIAEYLGDSDRAAELDARALGYRALYDPETGTLRPRMADGSFLTPYDPDAFVTQASTMGAGGPGFVEGSGWQYAFMVPFDIDGLIALHGGPEPFLGHVEALFTEERFTVFNEPDLAYPYLFTYLDGQAHQTQREVRRALDDHFGDGPDGLEGNDDAGTISAWYIFNAMGLYPATPGLAEYRIGSPLFE
ncbi:MAG: GH92 family glycosyl hydrolase, partial [Myxococcota bacterium]|nr:GH92 family glycosyl hydrolase [Myxococcota bacterium]